MFRRVQLLRLHHLLKPRTFTPNPHFLLTLRPQWNFSSQQNPQHNQQTNPSSSDPSKKGPLDSVSLFQDDPSLSISDYQQMLDSLRSSQGSSLSKSEQTLTTLRLLYKLGATNSVNLEDSKEAFRLYNEALSLAEKSQVTDAIETGFIYNGIGRLHLRDNKFDEAKAAFDKAGNIFAKFKDDSKLQPQIVQNLCSTAVVYEKKRDFDKALETFRHALQKVQDTPGEDAALASIAIYDGVGYVHFLRMEYDEAIDSWKKGSFIAIAQYGKGSVEARDFYENLAKTYIELEQYPEALEYAEKCYNADIEFYPTDSVGLIGGLYLLGKVYALMGDYDQTIQRYNKALELLEKDETGRPDQAGYTYLLLAKTYLRLSQMDDANGSFDKGRARVIKAFGDQSLELAEYLISWAKALKENAGTMDKAKLAYQEGLDIYKKLPNVNDESKRKMRDAFAAQGEIYFYEDNLEEALKFFSEFLRLSEAAKDTQRKLLSEVYSWTGSIHLQKEDYAKSVDSYEKALKLCTELDSNDLDREYHYRNLGTAYEKQGSLEKAQQTYQNALDFLHKAYGAHDELTRRSKTLLIDLLNKMNKPDEAEKIRELYKEHAEQNS